MLDIIAIVIQPDLHLYRYISAHSNRTVKLSSLKIKILIEHSAELSTASAGASFLDTLWLLQL